MASIFKKALGLFVEFEPDKPETAEPKKGASWGDDGLPLQVRPKARPADTGSSTAATSGTASTPVITAMVSKADADKFEKHFDELFDKANLPGPDYFEFWKMMETLEAAVPDTRTRMTAVFASLQVQGLSKDTLLATAAQYQQIIEKDRSEFQGAVNKKAESDLEGRKKSVEDLEKKNAENAALIQKLTKDIEENNASIVTLKKELIDEEAKLNNNKNGYTLACDAMMAMIGDDIQKIKTYL